MKKFETNIYKPVFCNLPIAFDKFRIAVVADLHDWDYDGRLEQALLDCKPDMIAFIGDIVQHKFDNHHLQDLFRASVKVAPCYFVTGNHEARLSNLDQILKSIADLGCVVMEDNFKVVSRGNQSIVLLGLRDVQLFKKHEIDKKQLYKQQLLKLLQKSTNESGNLPFRILLAHRPEFFEFYADNGIDLTLSGHVHGGQIRLFNKALFGLNQGIFPKYAAGLIERNSRYILVSRGLGHTKYTPLRINNKPELAIVELNRSADQTTQTLR